MPSYLQKTFDWQRPELVAIYDELPLWSARPGQLLLDQLDYLPHLQVLDIGFGTGFPLIQLARHFGDSCKVYGIDRWPSAIERAQQKAALMGLNNIQIFEADASSIPLANNCLDLITSNLGINNFEQPAAVLNECFRVLKPDGQLVISSNLVGTFQVFYDCFIQVAKELDQADLVDKIEAQQAHRSQVESFSNTLAEHGFQLIETVTESYQMKYVNGSAFLHDYFIIMGFLPSWKALVPEDEQVNVFGRLEELLNQKAEREGGLKMEVPLAVFKSIKK